jgi:hypothetical protein
MPRAKTSADESAGRQPEFPEIGRLREILRLMFRVLDVAFREVEGPLKLGYGYYSKVFGGLRDFRFEHVLQFCQITGLHPAEFFHWAYPRLPQKRSDAWNRLIEAQKAFSGDYEDGTSTPVAPFPVRLTEEEFEKLSNEAQHEILRLVELRRSRKATG